MVWNVSKLTTSIVDLSLLVRLLYNGGDYDLMPHEMHSLDDQQALQITLPAVKQLLATLLPCSSSTVAPPAEINHLLKPGTLQMKATL